MEGSMILQPGMKAPEFELPAAMGKRIALRAFRGQPVVLVFYPADFSPVCGDQVTLYNEALDEFARYDAAVLGISVDGVWCHQAYAKERKLKFQLLSDFEPKGSVAKKYGVYDEKEGVAQRALFVIDGDGMIRWSYLSPMDVNPGASGILESLESLNSGATR